MIDAKAALVRRKAAGALMTAKALKTGVKGVQRVTTFGSSSVSQKGDSASGRSETLDYPMFVQLLTSGRASAYLGDDHDDWEDHAHKLRLLKHAWNTADIDGDGVLTLQEMRDVGTNLLGHMTPDEFTAFWDLLTQSDDDINSLTYLDFLNGMAKAELHPIFAGKLEFLKPNQLMTVLVDVPVMQKEEKMMLGSLSFGERIGVNILRRKAQRVAERNGGKEREAADEEEGGTSPRDAAVFARLAQGTVHILTDEQRREVQKIHRNMILYGCLFGFLSSVITALSENVATYFLSTNGIENPDTQEPSSEEEIQQFAAIVASTLLVCSIIEIAMLYLYAIRHVMQTALAAGLQLTPLNRDRTHIAQFLVQAALELAHHNDAVHGVDPLKDSRQQSKFLVVFFLVLYKAKIALTSFLLKVALKRLVSRDAAKYAVPYMAVPATMLWNALIAHGVMKQAKLRSIGISAAVELFDSILNSHAEPVQTRATEPSVEKDSSPSRAMPRLNSADMVDKTAKMQKLSPLFKLQLLRAIGVVIVKRKGLYPTQEVLLKHAVHTLHMAGEVDHTSGLVDSELDFLGNMGKLSCHEQGQCMQVFVLTAILDGHFSRSERSLYLKLCASVDGQFQPHVTYIKHCAQRLRNTLPVTDVDIRHCVYWETGDGAHELAASYYVSECLHSLFSICTC
jgi:Ca2+-binding EF-hand superfamily protein